MYAKTQHFIFALFITLLFVSCSDSDDGIEVCANGLPCHYSYTVTLLCSCHDDWDGPHDVEIKNGQCINFDTGADLSDPDREAYIDYMHLEQLIAKAEQLLGQQDVDNDRVTVFQNISVEYHPLYNFMTEFQYDKGYAITNPDGTIRLIDHDNDGWGYKIENFKAH